MSRGLSSALGRLDAQLYRAERVVVGAFLLGMSLAMFLDVVHRVFSRSPGRMSVLVGEAIGRDPVQLDATVMPVFVGLATFGVAYLAQRTRRRAPGQLPPARGRAALMALATTAVLTAVVQGFVRLLPEGVVWAPYFALSLFLWVGLIGASMATYAGRHLALEMGEKLWPESLRPKVRALSKIVAGLFALLLALLGAMSVQDHLAVWLETPESALIPAVDIPKWMVFAVVPYAFTLVAARFLGYATGLLPTPPAEPEFELEEAK